LQIQTGDEWEKVCGDEQSSSKIEDLEKKVTVKKKGDDYHYQTVLN
jgi:hypothetical protein